MHVRGFTRHPSSGVSEGKQGTYAGLIEKIPYLQQLRITAVELLPVFQFDAQDCPPGLVNYWGYAPTGFFSPHQAYGSQRHGTAIVDEFRDMVKAPHSAGIEVILDVVFNHPGRQSCRSNAQLQGSGQQDVLLGHGNNIVVEHVEPFSISRVAFARTQKRMRVVFSKPAIKVEIVILLSPQHTRKCLPVNSTFIFG
jgi:hypothetical protein